MDKWLQPVEAALADAPQPVEFFFRNDDAGWEDERLYPMLDLFQRFGMPIDLAVIPIALGPGLTANLRQRAADGRLGLHTHGFNHSNHEPEGRKHEFGPVRSLVDQMRDLRTGKAILAEALGDLLDPIFTPPWNRCTATTAQCLNALGYRVLSRDITAKPIALGDLLELPVSVDWLRQRQGRRIDRETLGAMIGDAIRRGEPVGVMLHHAVMQDSDLDDVERLLRLLSASGAARCELMRTFAQPGRATEHAPRLGFVGGPRFRAHRRGERVHSTISSMRPSTRSAAKCDSAMSRAARA